MVKQESALKYQIRWLNFSTSEPCGTHIQGHINVNCEIGCIKNMSHTSTVDADHEDQVWLQLWNPGEVVHTNLTQTHPPPNNTVTPVHPLNYICWGKMKQIRFLSVL